MPLINSTPLSLSLAYYQSLVNRANKVFDDHVSEVTDSFNFAWKNQYGLTPQQTFDLVHQGAATVGSTAQQVYAIWQAAATFLNTLQPGCIPNAGIPAGWQLAWNSDGSAAVTQLVATSITITPSSYSLTRETAFQFVATVSDQNGNPLVTQPTFAWSAAGGTIDQLGNYTAPATAGSDTVTVAVGSLTATAVITVQ